MAYKYDPILGAGRTSDEATSQEMAAAMALLNIGPFESTDTEPTGLIKGNWGRAATAGSNIYTNFDGVTANGGDILEYNGTSWSVVDSSDLSDYETIGEGVSLLEYNTGVAGNDDEGMLNFPMGNTAWKHPRGDPEYAGTSTQTNYGSIAPFLMDKTVVFKVLQFRARKQAASDVVEIKVFKSTSLWAGGSTSSLTQLGSMITISTDEWDTTVGWREIELNDYCAVKKGEYLYIGMYGVNRARFARWLNAGSDPVRLKFFENSSPTLWENTAWSVAGGTDYAEPPILLTGQLTTEQYEWLSSLNTDISNKASQENDGALKSGYIPTERWIHPRGESEYDTDSAYGNSTYEVGFYEILDECIFDRITCQLYHRVFGESVEIRIYKNESGSVIEDTSSPSLTLLKTLNVTDLPTSKDFYTILLGEHFKINEGDIIQIFTEGTTVPARFGMWSTDGSYSDPARHGFLINNSGTPWAVDWDSTSPAGGFVSQSMKLQTFDNILNPEILLPAEVNVAIGREMNLWYDHLIFSPIEQNQVVLSGYSDNPLLLLKKRSFRLTPDAVSDDNLIIKALDFNRNVIESKLVNIKSVSNSNGTGLSLQSIFMGDSVMSSGIIPTEVKNLFDTDGGLTDYDLLGTQGSGVNLHEGYPGYRWEDFATDVSARVIYEFTVSGVDTEPQVGAIYTHASSTYEIDAVNMAGDSGTLQCSRTAGTNNPSTPGTLTKLSGVGDASISASSHQILSGNPFWHGGRVDFRAYMSTNGFTGNIDYLNIMLGINDVDIRGVEKTDTEIAEIIAYAKVVIDAMLTDNTYGYTGCKITIGLPPLSGNTNDGFAVNYGSGYSYVYHKNLRKLWAAYINEFDNAEYHANVSVCAVGAWVDRTYGYTRSLENVSDRGTETEYEHTNYVHPNGSGLYQIADAFYSHQRGLI